jgi:predicted O-methyltransferase YrrM
MHSVLQLLHPDSPYAGFDPSGFVEDTQGWGSDDPIFQTLIETFRPKLIVEVGTWKGASALNMARIARDIGFATEIVCVDTWLGSPEHLLAQQDGWRESLLIKHGFPHLYFTFLGNVVRAGYTDLIVPLPATSENAHVVLRGKGLQPDLVYIDAAHEEEPALRDLRLYWDLLAPGGVLLGDDYGAWEGVSRAAHRFADEVGATVYAKWSKFVLLKEPAAIDGAMLEGVSMLRRHSPVWSD